MGRPIVRRGWGLKTVKDNRDTIDGRRHRLLAMPLALGLAAPAAALAQTTTVPEGVGVADRARPEYQPIGGRIGSFFLYPNASVVLESSDNVRATQNDRQGDTVAFLSARARLRSIFTQHALNAQVFADQSFYARLTGENVTRYGGQVDGYYDVSRNTRILGQVRAERTADPRTSFNNLVGTRRPIRYGRYNASLTGQQTLGRLDLTAGVGWRAFRFEDTELLSGATLNQGFRDADILTGSLSAGYRIRPGMAAIVRSTVDRVDYVLAASDPRQPVNLDRNSRGVRVEGGLRFDLTSLLYGEVRAGYLSRDYADPRLQDASGTSFGADLLWNVTPLTSLRLAADRRIDEAASTTIVGNRVTTVGATVDHELRRNVILTLQGERSDIEPIGGLGTARDLFASASAKYFANRQLSLRAYYRYGRRTAPVAAIGFEENRVSVGAYLTF